MKNFNVVREKKRYHGRYSEQEMQDILVRECGFVKSYYTVRTALDYNVIKTHDSYGRTEYMFTDEPIHLVPLKNCIMKIRELRDAPKKAWYLKNKKNRTTAKVTPNAQTEYVIAPVEDVKTEEEKQDATSVPVVFSKEQMIADAIKLLKDEGYRILKPRVEYDEV